MKFYTAIMKKSGDQYVVLCLEFGVVGSGYTRREAQKSLEDAIQSYLEYVKDEGLSLERPVSIKELHEFLEYPREVTQEFKKEKIKILAYA